MSAEAWTAVFTAISTLVLVIAAAVAWWNLRIIAKTHRLHAFEVFLKGWQAVRNSRQYVLETFAFDPDHPPDLESKEGKHLRAVINNLNEVGMLLERNIIPARYILALCYPDIIRCDSRLQQYLEYREKELGVRYGRRIHRLGQKARRYHDIRPEHRATRVRTRVPPASNYVVVYETTLSQGFAGLLQRMRWWIRRMFGLY